MLKVLLINPSQENIIPENTGWRFGLKDAGYYQPLGILYVATYLKKNMKDIEVEVIDAASPDIPYVELEDKIKQYNPNIVGISTYTVTFIDALKIVKMAKKINPAVHINLGGHHLSFFAKETLQHEGIDSIIIGEGEIKFFELVNCLMRGKDIENIDGVFTRNNKDKIDAYDEARHFLSDISELPFPERELVKGHRYYNVLTLDKKMTTIVSSRGCPYNCTFCSQAREPYRQRFTKNVVDEIEDCMSQGYTDFFFAEDTFNINKKKVTDFCNEVKKRRLEFSWCCKARIHGLDFETLNNMAETGCYLVNLGVETGTDRGLKLIQKGTTTEEIRQVFTWCRKLKIKTFAYFIIGHPFEKSKKDIMDNIDFLISIEPDYCNINILTPYPFTELFDDGVQKGLLSYDPWDKLVLYGESFIIKNWGEHFSKKELGRLKMKAVIKFYFRPRYILKQLLNVSSLKQLGFKMKVASNMIGGFFRKR